MCSGDLSRDAIRNYFSSKLTVTRAVIEICPSASVLSSSEDDPDLVTMLKLLFCAEAYDGSSSVIE
jgi:hypothetical protein